MAGEIALDSNIVIAYLNNQSAVVSQVNSFSTLILPLVTRLKPYQQTLQEFEMQYNMTSAVFYPQFEQGLLGDNMDFFEWAGIFELRQALLTKIKRLELAL